ncbi:MAG: ABC transporter ATP-binding protein [Clostridia bacterium]|nr:ABC transporter ATP-binding protein [Clostridia bacterium]
MALLRTENISIAFDGRQILRDISVSLEEGELVSLLGLSGSGKSTLLNIISGLLPPDAGRVFLEEEEITGRPGHVSYMLQKDLLLEHKRIIDNVCLPLTLRGTKRRQAHREAGQYFDQFGLSGTERLYPAQLSGGMRQRAALLRTYLSSRKIVLLDEPFSALDMITKGQMHEWYLDVMHRVHLTTLLITHDVNEAILLSDRVCLLTGSPGEIRHVIRIEAPWDQRKDFELTPEFLSYKQQIMGLLRS